MIFALISSISRGSTETSLDWDVNDGLTIGDLPVKLKGVNLAPSFTIEGMTIGWKRMFDNWATLWPTYIQPNILIFKEELGVNCIRLIGDPEQFYRSTSIDSSYLDKYAEFIEFCREENLYVIATCCGWGDWGADGESYVEYAATEQEIIDNMILFCQMCDEYPNVVGIDLIQEFNGWGKAAATRTESQNVNFAIDSIDQIKTAGVTKPLTFSYQPWGTYETIFDQTVVAATAAYFDYLDFHIYYPLYDIDDMDIALTYGKPIIWGETAVARFGTLGYSGQRGAFIEALQEHIEDPNLLGFAYWCGAEDEPLSGRPAGWEFNWGFFDNEGNAYTPSDNEKFLAIPIPAT